jgi:SAM-dependent methyltransferase
MSTGLPDKKEQQSYRVYVGPVEDYDIIGAIQVSLLFAAGLRQHHRLLDLGCGSLRGGRMLIPYLDPGNYYGVEPNTWLINEGLKKETGLDIINVKRPTFYHFNDFSIDTIGIKFDFIIAQSILSHTFPDLMKKIFQNVGKALAEQGKFLATFCTGSAQINGKGWSYPGTLPFTWEKLLEQITGSGLTAYRLNWFHPRQVWFIAGLTSNQENINNLAHVLNEKSPEFAGFRST